MRIIIGATIKDALNFLNGKWLRGIGIVLLCYIIKLVLETLPVQGSISIQMAPVAVASSETLISLVITSVVNSILFFIMIDYITNTQYTMRKRFVKACTYPFRNWHLLYKGLAVFFITNLLLYVIGMMMIYAGLGSLFTYAAGVSLWSGILFAAYLLVFAFIIWLFLGISQAMYILYDDPGSGIYSSMKESFLLMKGYKWPLLGLFVLTGIGLILGVLLFVVGLVVSLAIYEVSRLVFYRALIQKRRQREWHAKFNE
ncbi:DUF975 family protein [Halobacillus litoralis]|uniref:DUF975 family protein n=1 Tax=Halobacillus litoralis TaxID=45668 RepID=UPI0024922420|nr:DUF975 family protein [Halobacillus litoralis]